jgi:3-dehydroquinate dehydratase
MKELLIINGMLQGLPHIEKIKAEQDLHYKKYCKDFMREVSRPSIECHLSNVVVYSLSNDLISCDCLRK